MRVLHLDSGRQMRGGQYQALRLVKACGSGHKLLARPGSPLYEAGQRAGIDMEPLSLPRLVAAVRRCDLVHAHDARSHTLAALAGGAPLIVSRRVAFPIGQTPASRWKYSRATHFIAVSEYVKSRLVEGGVEAERVSVVYDGVRIPATLSRGVRVIAPAFSDPMKGADLAVEAARLGGFEIYYSSDLERDLPEAALLLYLTRSEGLGSAALLAMAHGVPVVASRVGGLLEIVEDGVTGMLTENEPGAIAAAVAAALARREELGWQARRRVESRFSEEAMVLSTLAVYGKVLGC